MKNTSLHQDSPLRRAATWLALCALFLAALCSPAAHAETKTVVAEGSTEVCFGRETGIKLARTATTNDAHRECHALGLGWSYTGNQFPGYEQCTRCGKSEEFRCTVKQAVYICTNMQKEREEKAAKERAEKAAAAKTAKDKADQLKAEREAQQKAAREKLEKERAEKAAANKVAREKAESGRLEKAAKAAAEQSDRKKNSAAESNSIEDAFSKLEKQSKAPAARTGDIDDEFKKMEAYRAEQERLRIAALKARLEQEARVQALKERTDEATRFCATAFKERENCLKDACGREPRKTICTESRADPVRDCPAGTRCIVFPSFTCISTGPNPEYSKWESCSVGAKHCVGQTSTARNPDECVQQRLRTTKTGR